MNVICKVSLSCDLPVSVASLHSHSQILSCGLILKCLSYTNFINSLEEVGHPGTFCLLFYEFCEFWHV